MVSFAACSAGLHPGSLPGPDAMSGTVATGRHSLTIGGLSSHQYVAANLLIPLQMSDMPNQNANVFSLAGTPQCGPAQPGNPCPGSSVPPYIPTTPVTSYVAATTLNAPCTVTSTVASVGRRIAMASMPPGVTPPPPPTPTPAATQCYIIAFEGNNGPYIVQGPGLVVGPNVTSFNPVPNTVHFLANTQYTFYFAYVTAFLTPIPSPSPTPTPTPAITPMPSVAPSPTATPSAAPSVRPTPSPSPTAEPSPGCVQDGDNTDERRVSENGGHRLTTHAKQAEDKHHGGGNKCHSSPDHSGHGDNRNGGGDHSDGGGDHTGGDNSTY